MMHDVCRYGCMKTCGLIDTHILSNLAARTKESHLSGPAPRRLTKAPVPAGRRRASNKRAISGAKSNECRNEMRGHRETNEKERGGVGWR